MTRLRDVLFCVLLMALTAFCLRAWVFLDQASGLLAELQRLTASSRPPIVAAAEEVRDAAREQRRYYKATAKAVAITAIRAGRLVENADARLERIGVQTEKTLQSAETVTQAIGDDAQELLRHATFQIVASGQAATQALEAANANLEQWKDLGPDLASAARNSAESAANLEHATGSIKVALEPLRRPAGRLRTILRWVLGLPKINLR